MILPLLGCQLLDSCVGIGIVLNSRTPLLNGGVGAEVDVSNACDADPRPKGKVGDGRAVKGDEARAALLLLLKLVLEDLVEAGGFAFEPRVDGFLRLFSVGTRPKAMNVVDITLMAKKRFWNKSAQRST